MRNLNCGLNAAMSSAPKFYDGTREVRAIGILRFSPGRLIPLNSRGRRGGQLQSPRFYKFDNEAVGHVFFNVHWEGKILEFCKTPWITRVSSKSQARRRDKMEFVDGILI